MGTGYTRQSAAQIADGNTITALGLEDEFDAIQAAMAATTGHSHDDTTGEGPKINLTTSISGVLPVANGGIAGINKLNAVTNPTVNDDSGDGYAVGSTWIDTTNDFAYQCLDATLGAAVWQTYQPFVATPGAGIATFLATPTSANLAAAVTNETGSGALVFATSPTLVTPVLGAAAGTSLSLSGLTASSAVATDGSKNLVSVTNTGSGSNVLATSPTLVTPALGTPSALVLTNATGLPISTGVSGLAANMAAFLAGGTSAQFAAAVTNETGTGTLVFSVDPALTGTPTAPTAAPGTNTTQIATTAYATAADTVVTNASIQNSLLTTRGDIISRGAGAPQRLAAGTQGAVLTMNATDPNWEIPDYMVVEAGSLGTGATKDIVLTSYLALGFIAFRLTLEDARPATNNTQIILRISNNAGSSYLTTGYRSQFIQTDETTISTGGVTAQFQLAGAVGNTAPQNAQITAEIKTGATTFFCNSTTNRIDGTPVMKSDWQIGKNNTGSVDAIRLLPASGNWAAGTYSLVGMKEG